jgi:hypothetical protein
MISYFIRKFRFFEMPCGLARLHDCQPLKFLELLCYKHCFEYAALEEFVDIEGDDKLQGNKKTGSLFETVWCSMHKYQCYCCR